MWILLSLFTLTGALPRGAQPSNAHLYTDRQFQCSDSTQNIPISFVNDDYCDCMDGSDEPGTSACSNGVFYCTNKGFKGTMISSSRVDDGICDCCDGSDEILGACQDNCQQLGVHLQAEAKRIRREQAMGFQTRLGYSTDGKAALDKRTADILVLQQETDDKRVAMEERSVYMTEVEKPAIAAKEAAQALFDKEEEKRSAGEAEENRLAAEAEYTKMDANGDGDVTTEELLEYASSADSVLPHDETTLLIEGSDEIQASAILDFLQTKLSQANEEKKREDQERKEKKRAKKPKLPEPVVAEEAVEEWGEDGKLIQREVPPPPEIEEEAVEEEEEEEEEEAQPITNTVEYDEDTQRLIDVYEEAQSLHNAAKDKFDVAERQLKNLKKIDEIDFGVDQEFYALNGQCFHFSDQKYNYLLCPFDRSEQDGTNLGRWEGWVTDDKGNKYSSMKYSNGQTCWNGPARSTVVEIVCGIENEIFSASEPAKCEYLYKFRTPAACHKVQEESEIHEEL